MIRQNTHFVISKSISNQKKVNNTLERVILTQGRSQPKISGGGAKLHRLVQWRTQDSASRGSARGLGAEPPVATDF